MAKVYFLESIVNLGQKWPRAGILLQRILLEGLTGPAQCCGTFCFLAFRARIVIGISV